MFNTQRTLSPQKAYRDILITLGGEVKNLIVLDTDISRFTGTDLFKKQFADRYFHLGLSYAHAVGFSIGMSLRKKLPFISTTPLIASARMLEYIRTGICLPNLNIKIVGSLAGFSGYPFAPHFQCLSDIALMRSLPNMKIFCPADYYECLRIFEVCVRDFGPTYIRLSGEELPVIYDDTYRFSIGRGNIIREGNDVTLFALGPMVKEALKVSDLLSSFGIHIRVINMSSLKPLDTELILQCASTSQFFVTLEDHRVFGGLFTSVSECMASFSSVKIYPQALPDTFIDTVSNEDAYIKYGLDFESVAEQIKRCFILHQKAID